MYPNNFYPNGYGYPNNVMMGANMQFQGSMDMRMGQMERNMGAMDMQMGQF